MRIVGAAFLLMVMAASLAFPHGGRGDGGSSSLSSPAGAGQTPRAAATRFAVYDSEYLAQQSVYPRADGTLTALKSFGSALNVQLFDIAAVQGKVFIADDRIDLSDAFIKAVKSRPSGATSLAVPAVNVPAATLAFIDTEAFGDAQKGVTNLLKAFSKIEQDFGPRREELKKLREEATAASGDRKQKLEAEVGRRQQSAQAALDKRVRELTGPVYEDIGRALMLFCKKNGITFVFDTSKMKKTDTLPPFDLPLPADAPDITEAFVAAYNQGELKP